ncbi:MAG TPA: hypothetical protein VIN73_08815 [Vicingaceae bacterium]
MKKELVINVSNLKELHNNFKESTILDLSGSIDCKDKVIPSDFFDEATIYPLMLKKYWLFSENIINVNRLLNIKVNNLSIYWLSACAVKYHSRHWAKDFFLLLTILEQCQQKIEQNYTSLVLVLPTKISTLKNTIEALLQKQHYTLSIHFVFDNQATYTPSLGAIIKGVISQLRQIKQLKITAEKVTNSIYLHGNRPTEIQFRKAVEQLFTENKKVLTPIPYYWQTDKLPVSFLQHKPSILQLITLVAQLIKAYYRINKLPHSTINIGSCHQLSTSFLRNELKLTLRKNIHLFIYQQWLSNYFSTLKQSTSIFFEDEFYEIGRTISSVSKPFKNITSYGMQHAHFMEMHTVYSIYDKELEKGLPIPDHFVTWGKGYNQLFLQHNSLPESYTKALGNPIYIRQNIATTFPTTIKNILWCLTTKECMNIEWNCMKNAISHTNYNLNIRLHPLKHISEEEVIDKLKGIHFTFHNEGSIQEAIAQNDLIVSSAHSTTFLDATIAKKYSIRITSRFWNGTMNMDNAVLKTVKNEEEFSQRLSYFDNVISSNDNDFFFIEMNVDYWRKFLASNN